MANQDAIFDQVKAIFHDPDLRMWFDCIPQADCEELSFQMGEVLGSALINRKDLKSNILQARTKVKDFVRKLFKGGGKKKALSRLNDSDTVKPGTEPNVDPTDVRSGSAANKIDDVLALPGPRQVDFNMGAVNNYRHGGQMSAIEHINYRHAYESGFENVSRFSQGTSARNISNYIDEASRYGTVTPQGANGFKIEYDFGRAIGTNQAGDAATQLRIFIRDGNLQTAFPY